MEQLIWRVHIVTKRERFDLHKIGKRFCIVLVWTGERNPGMVLLKGGSCYGEQRRNYPDVY